MAQTYLGDDGAWHVAKKIYSGRGGQWKENRVRLIGQGGKWVESYNNEVQKTDGTLDITALSLRGGNKQQAGLVLTGQGFSDIAIPSPASGAYYPLRGSTAEYFSNFGNGILNGAPAYAAVNGSKWVYFDQGSNNQYFSFPFSGGAAYDGLGLVGNDAFATSALRGTKYWEVLGQWIADEMPTGSNQEYVFWMGTLAQHICVYFTADGTLHARFRNGANYVKDLTIASAVTLNQGFGFAFRHVNGSPRSLQLVLSDGRSTTLNADLTRTLNGTSYQEFFYFLPVAGVPILFGTGYQYPGTATATKFFLPENTNSVYTISTDGLELSGTNTGTYRAAFPSGFIASGTGKYYLEIQNRSTYDMHFGLTDQQQDLTAAPGALGYCVGTIGGKKFTKQTGSGSGWSTAIPANSTIGLVYDSDAHSMDVYVGGTVRTTPFAAGSLPSVPLRFIIGGVAQTSTTNLFNPKIVLSSASWTNKPTGTFNQFPLSTVMNTATQSFSKGHLRNAMVHNVAMTSSANLQAVINPNLSLKVIFKGESDNVEHDASTFIAKSTPTQITMSVPDLTAGNYDVIARLTGSTDSTPKLFSINSFAARTAALHIDFSTATLKEINDTFMCPHMQWGGLNGGVSSDNVTIDQRNGYCEIAGLGDQYTGSILGVGKNGTPSGFNTRIGGGIVTREYMGAGSYRVVIKPTPLTGVVNAIWPFHYESGDQGSALYNQIIADGLGQQGDAANGIYAVRNHEIDIEMPTALKTDPDQQVASFQNARCNTWRGEKDGEYTDPFIHHGINMVDGNYHEIGFDWHILPSGASYVDFYFDGSKLNTNNTNIPDIPGRFWIALWFPSSPGNHWAGLNAAWARQVMLVKSFTYTPFSSEIANQRLIGETNPLDVFKNIKNFRF